MSGKWTPGPWKVECLGGSSTVLSATRPRYNNTRSPSYGYIGEGGPFCIASVFCDRHGPRLDFVAFSHDDARLIAQSPELADVLEAMVERFGHDIFTMPPEDRDLLTRAAAVLAKAKGEGA
ncbi:hypothetical protein C0V97_04150 [Asaia sp. W19]|uniref:hypothetical protein n=1 Tax=unclassified Asaia TaxID=2685023 RepID=UPI000F8F2CD6|nr:hypothetical protein [Asaia sp. W19]RUT26879.1 hypothetical protein C0V97_04150 [Asaia sp. W19]